MNEQDYTFFLKRFKTQFGIDLSLYKQERMKRRIDSFLSKNGCNTYTELLSLIQQRKILDVFIEYLTINVSGFFRNYTRWGIFENKILPALIARNPGKLKIWSAACSSGEEPYTLSIILSRLLPKHRYDILATDIDAHIIKKAEQGKYDAHAISEVPSHLVAAHFSKKENYYFLHDNIKQTVRFKQHDLLLQPYEHQFDLIVCRNVMIYFTEQAKDTVYQKFSRALRKEGILFVGSTEQVLTPEKYQFRIADTFFYEKQ